jgi:hypothetical protein
MLALPAEPTATVIELARRFGAASVVVVEGRGNYPAALGADTRCFTGVDPAATGGAQVFVIAGECLR